MAKVSDIAIDYVLEQYLGKQRALEEIAEELGTYSNKLRRMLRAHGTKLRTKGEAQKLAIQNGRAQHPTKGKKRSQETKVKIGSARAIAWNSMSEEERQKISEKVKKQWSEMPESEKESLQNAAQKGIRKASKEGSKLENDLLANLVTAGYKVQGHKKFLIANEDMHLDLVIPELKVVIEIDGPSHYISIWGPEKLQKAQQADAKKNGLLLNYGYVVIRVKALSNEISNHKFSLVLDEIKTILYNISQKFPEENDRLIYVDA